MLYIDHLILLEQEEIAVVRNEWKLWHRSEELEA